MQRTEDRLPTPWRRDVIAILRREKGLRDVVQRAAADWRKLDATHTTAGLYEVLAEALELQEYTAAKRVEGMVPEGEVFSFVFPYRLPTSGANLKLFAKINLREGRLAVIVYSAHQ